MSYFNHTQHYRQYCFVGNKTEDCKLGLFQDASFAGDLSDSKIKFRRSVVRIGIAYIRSNCLDEQETSSSLSHSGAESEKVSLIRLLWQMCAQQNHWLAMLTKGAITTTQWESVMRLFDIHTPSQHFRIILICSLFTCFSRNDECLQLTARLREPWAKNWKNLHTGVVNQRSAAWRKPSALH